VPERDAASVLAEALSPGAADPEASDLARQVSERLATKPADPVVTLVMRRLAEQEAVRNERQTADAELRELLEALRVELRTLRGRSKALAAALGACPRCWGEDPRCPTCHGHGGPGWARPHEASFATWIAPALESRPPPAGGHQPRTEGDEHGQRT
jgi:hypothetical protein